MSINEWIRSEEQKMISEVLTDDVLLMTILTWCFLLLVSVLARNVFKGIASRLSTRDWKIQRRQQAFLQGLQQAVEEATKQVLLSPERKSTVTVGDLFGEATRDDNVNEQQQHLMKHQQQECDDLLCSHLFSSASPVRVFEVELTENEICDKKTSACLHGGAKSHSLLYLRKGNQDNNHHVNENVLSIQGIRKCVRNSTSSSRLDNEHFFAFQGLVNTASGQAYWVDQSGEDQILTMGQFRVLDNNTLSFEGEWLSSKGERGRYTQFSCCSTFQLQQDQEPYIVAVGIPLGINSSNTEEEVYRSQPSTDPMNPLLPPSADYSAV